MGTQLKTLELIVVPMTRCLWCHFLKFQKQINTARVLGIISQAQTHTSCDLIGITVDNQSHVEADSLIRRGAGQNRDQHLGLMHVPLEAGEG